MLREGPPGGHWNERASHHRRDDGKLDLRPSCPVEDWKFARSERMTNSESAKLIKIAPQRQIVNAAITIAALTAVVRSISVVKELIVAWRFGTSDDLDAFLISLLVPVAVISILAGSFNAAFIPVYIHTRENQGREAARLLFQLVIGWALLLLVLAALLIVLGAPLYLPLIGSGFNAEKLQLTFKLVCLSAPVVMLSGIAVLCSAALNAERRFAISAAVPLATPVLTVCFLWLAPTLRSFALIAGLVCGAAIEVLLLGFALKLQGFSLRPRRPRLDPNVRRLAAQFLPAMSGSILTSGNFLVDQAMAAMLPAGSVAALSYGNRIVQFPIVIAATALGTAVMPYFSTLAANRNWNELRVIIHRGLKLTLMITGPLALLLFLFSEPLVGVLFKRGAFTSNDVHLVGRIQAFYALQIPFYIAGIMVVRLISAVQANRLLLWASAINLVINVGLNYLFMRWLGVAGIALSTSVVYLFSTTFCYFAIMRRMPRASER
jgi:putative peptidoglycan lipid II flippase